MKFCLSSDVSYLFGCQNAEVAHFYPTVSSAFEQSQFSIFISIFSESEPVPDAFLPGAVSLSSSLATSPYSGLVEDVSYYFSLINRLSAECRWLPLPQYVIPLQCDSDTCHWKNVNMKCIYVEM